MRIIGNQKDERDTKMGMSASQARFLCLTARKNNVEFEGQQINQQRTTLSNESGSYYAQLCNMVVPTPPSVDDYTKVTYTFDDGALTNTITTMIAQDKNRYSISYIQQWQDDYSIVSSASSLVSKNDEGVYKIGSATLRELGVSPYSIALNGKAYQVHEGDDENGPYISIPVTDEQLVNADEYENLEYYYIESDGNITKLDKHPVDGYYYYINNEGNEVQVPTDSVTITLIDENQTGEDAIVMVRQDNENFYRQPYVGEATNVYLKDLEDKLSENSAYSKLTDEQINALKSMPKSSYSNLSDSYLSSLTEDQLNDLMEQESYYMSMLNEKMYNNPSSDEKWYVRYVKDSNIGSYVPYFYNEVQVNSSDYADGFALTSVDCYTLGSTTKTKEVLNTPGSVQKDSTGRYISILLYQTDEDGNIRKDEDGNEMYTEYSLVTNTTTDDDAYNDAMNKYNYEQYLYDQKIQDINSKIEIIQQQDKALELELKQLDTEENAINTEMDAVKKVISKNVESSFKTFG